MNMKHDRWLPETNLRTDGRLLVSYPKSGRTWIRYALGTSDLTITFTHAGAATNRVQIGCPYLRIPEQMRAVPMIFLHRNPIDTAVSMYYQVHHKDLRKWSGRWWRVAPRLLQSTGLPPKNIDDFVRHPIWGTEKVCRYNRLWLDHLTGRDDCLILTYEEMRADPEQGFQRILDHIGESATTGAALSAASNFEQMKAVEKSVGLQSIVRAPVDSPTPKTFKVRKGKVKGYLDEITADTADFCREIAARYGFSG